MARIPVNGPGREPEPEPIRCCGDTCSNATRAPAVGLGSRMAFPRAADRVRHGVVGSVVTLGLGLLLGAALGACSSTAKPNVTGTAGATGTAGGGSGSAGSGTAGSTTGPGTAGTAGGGSGTAGASGTAGGGAAGATGGGSGTAGGGAAGAAGSQSNQDAGPIIDGNAGDFPKAACAPGAIFCDDFEEYDDPKPFNCPAPNGLCDFTPMGSTTPTWLGYHFHGPPYTVVANVFGGKQVYQLDTEGGHPVASDIIKESPDGVDLWPAAHYGRVMVNLKGLPVVGSVGIMTESGLLPGSTTNTAQYTLGSTDGKLSFSYAQRTRPFKNDVSTPTKRIGGNWENATQKPTTLCTVTATTETIATNKWVCVEWRIDSTKPELHVWLDGVPQTQVDVSGGGGTCSAGTAPTWTGPAHFTELDLGWEINGNDAGGRGAQFDMFAIGMQQLGCPTP
jgi:hypothetical protein